jgi:hypothetical protein
MEKEISDDSYCTTEEEDNNQEENQEVQEDVTEGIIV